MVERLRSCPKGFETLGIPLPMSVDIKGFMYQISTCAAVAGYISERWRFWVSLGKKSGALHRILHAEVLIHRNRYIRAQSNSIRNESRGCYMNHILFLSLLPHALLASGFPARICCYFWAIPHI